MTAAKPSGLYAKLLDAQTKAHAVEKKGQNKDQGYSYAQASDVIEEAQKALHEAGLVGYMQHGEVIDREVESQRGSAGLFVTIISTLVVVDPETGDDLRVEVQGTGVDYPGDKAVYKAMTGAAKYAYASVLGIPFGDDPEAETGGAGQARKTGSSGKEASPAQKRAVTTILRKANVGDELARAIVHAVAGDPPTMGGMSEILDLIKPVAEEPENLAAAVDKLAERAKEAGAEVPSDVPGHEEAEAEADAARQAQAELGDEPPEDEGGEGE